jgi:hypothetical protein
LSCRLPTLSWIRRARSLLWQEHQTSRLSSKHSDSQSEGLGFDFRSEGQLFWYYPCYSSVPPVKKLELPLMSHKHLLPESIYSVIFQFDYIKRWKWESVFKNKWWT